MIQCDDFDLHPMLYRTFMITLSIVTPPVNIFALYCIVRKSSKQMGHYKWYLLAYQLVSCTFDFVFTVLIVPVVFFPIPMGYADSPLARWMSLSSHAALIIFISSVPFLAVSILSLFSYRCQLIIPRHHFLKTSQRGQFYFTIILLAVYSVPVSAGLVNISPNQIEAKQWVLEEYSCAKSVIDAPRLHVYTPTSIRRLVITASVLGIFAIIFLLYILWLSFHFLNKGDHLSHKTKLLQRRFLIYLCIQVSVPLFIFVTPVLILMYMFGTSAPIGQGGGNFALCCMGFHGALSPVSLILCNDNYRKFTFAKMRCRYRRNDRKVNTSYSVEQNLARSATH
ncbi:hypothetical protein Aduo_000780 [Ancylostoma duodenale]